jgi:hypothetical protein
VKEVEGSGPGEEEEEEHQGQAQNVPLIQHILITSCSIS